MSIKKLKRPLLDNRTIGELSKNEFHKEINELVEVLHTAKTNPSEAKLNPVSMSDNNGDRIYYNELLKRRKGKKPESKSIKE